MVERFAHKKSLGQNFLNSDYAPKKMCDAASLQRGDVVLEIGPGTGALTKELLARDANVIALEADPRAVESLELTFASEIAAGKLTLHHHDARSIEPASFGVKNLQYKVISNIPYYLTGFLFRTLLETDCQPNTLVFLVQKEVALRIARDKKESLLSLAVKVYGDPSYVCTIGRGHFTPSPKVDSAVIAITDISKKRLAGIDERLFFTLLHLGFGKKRKQLLHNFAAFYKKEQLQEIAKKLSLSPTIRAEDISLQGWLALVMQLQSTPISSSKPLL